MKKNNARLRIAQLGWIGHNGADVQHLVEVEEDHIHEFATHLVTWDV